MVETQTMIERPSETKTDSNPTGTILSLSDARDYLGVYSDTSLDSTITAYITAAETWLASNAGPLQINHVCREVAR